MLIDNFRGRYWFLSNFYPSKLTDRAGVIWPTAEHMYQGLKSDDPVDKDYIRSDASPHFAKRAGQHVAIRKRWDDEKISAMLRVLRCKFAKGSLLAQMLLDTMDAELVEGNTWHDNYWGECRCKGCERKMKKNNLGRLLMQVRSELKTC